MRKLIMLVAILAVALLAASPALAQDEPAVVADAKAKEAKSGGAVPEGAEKKSEKAIFLPAKELPKTGGLAAFDLVLPATVMLIGSGIVAHAVVRRRR